MKRFKFKFMTVKNAMETVLAGDEESKGMRVAEKAVMETQNNIEDYLGKVVRKAAMLARHGRRKTIKREDIKLALDIIQSQG